MRNRPVSLAIISVLCSASSAAFAQAPPAPPAATAPAAPAAAAPAATPLPPLAPAPVVSSPPPPPSATPAPVAAPPPPPAASPAPGAGSSTAPSGSSSYAIEFMSLRLMREKGVISQAEYESAVHDLRETSGQHAPEEGTVVIGKWATTLYGFAEADYIYDTTRSFNDGAGEALIARPSSSGGNNAGDNGRMTMGVRNSRIGFRLKAPEVACGIRTSAHARDGLPRHAAAGREHAAVPRVGGRLLHEPDVPCAPH